MSSLLDYLSKNYDIDKKKKKKKKKSPRNKAKKMEPNDSEIDLDDDPVIVASKQMKGAWKNVETNETIYVNPEVLNDGTFAGLKADIGDEKSNKIEYNEEHEDINQNQNNGKRKLMNDGTFAGLQTSEQINESAKAKDAKLKKEMETTIDHNNETIYRDSSGRKVESSHNLDRESEGEIRRRQNQAYIRTLNQNEKKIIDEIKEGEKLQSLKNEGINLYESNQNLIKSKREKIAEEDPALMFNKKIIKNYKNSKNGKFTSITGRKLYTDVTKYPINRFDVKPGCRWDGIIRGNGFEKRWLDRQVEVKENHVLQYTMAKDDT